MTLATRPLSAITQQAIELLAREIGVVDTVRFLGQFSTGYGNYTEERDVLFKDLTLDGILEEIRKAPEA
jgi:hypothetical protein